MVLDFDDSVSGLDGRSPELSVSELPEGCDESLELVGERSCRVFERKRVELPGFLRIRVHEFENSLARTVLDSSSACGADSELAGFASEKETPSFEVACDVGVAATGLESLDPSDVGVDAREEV